MPSRIVRESLLYSERYWSASIHARELFFGFILTADDFGLVSLSLSDVARRCYPKPPRDKTIRKRIAELEECDLVRTYECDGHRYGFIPRYRQVLRVKKATCPMPPAELYKDDLHASELFKENKGKFRSAQSICTASAVQTLRRSASEVELKGNEKEVKCEDTATAAQQEGRSPFADKDIEQVAQERGISQRPGERREDFRQRVVLVVLEQEAARKRQAAPPDAG